MNIIQQENNLSSSRRLTISQALDYFGNTLSKPNNYLRLTRKYLMYCVTNGYTIDQISMKMYTVGQSPSMVSPIRKFLKFAQQHGIFEVVADPAKSILSPAANELILQFIDDAKNLEDNSKQTYLKNLNEFFYYLQDQGGSQQGFDFSGKTVARYLQFLKNGSNERPALSPHTISVRLSAIKQLASWVISKRHQLSYELTTEQLDNLRDVSEVRGPRMEQMFHKDGLNEEGRNRLLATVIQPKWKAIISLLSYEGLRTVEVTRLQRKDVDLKEMKLWVLGKGRDIKLPIKLFETCANHIALYLKQRPQITGTDMLFPELTTAKIRYHVNKYLLAAGLKTDRVSAHSLRHTAGQILIAKGVDPIYVQQHLRHKDFSTTQIYVAQQTQKEYFNSLPEDV